MNFVFDVFMLSRRVHEFNLGKSIEALSKKIKHLAKIKSSFAKCDILLVGSGVFTL